MKIQMAHFKGTGESLNASEVMLFACQCKTFFPDNISASEKDKLLFTDIWNKANSAVQNSSVLQLSAVQVECFRNFEQRSVYQDNEYYPMSNQERLKGWLRDYDRYKVDGSHWLDGQMDRKQDYTVELINFGPDYSGLFEILSSAKIEEYAKKYFFAKIATVEKLEHFKKHGKGVISLSAGEARILIDIRRNFEGKNPRRASNLYRTTDCKLDATTNSKTNIEWTHAEVSQLLNTCKEFARPKPLPGNSSRTSARVETKQPTRRSEGPPQNIFENTPEDALEQLTPELKYRILQLHNLQQEHHALKVSKEELAKSLDTAVSQIDHCVKEIIIM